jgi:hypothetical protein
MNQTDTLDGSLSVDVVAPESCMEGIKYNQIPYFGELLRLFDLWGKKVGYKSSYTWRDGATIEYTIKVILYKIEGQARETGEESACPHCGARLGLGHFPENCAGGA